MSQYICNMWLPLLLVLLPLGLICTTPQEESKDPTLKTMRQEVGQDNPKSAHQVRQGQPTATPAALHQHEGLQGAGMQTRDAHDACGQGGNGGNLVDALKSSQSQDNPRKVDDSLTQPPVINTRSSPSLPSGGSGETPCFATFGHLGDGLREALTALQNGWSRERELGKETLDQFGICTGSDGSADAGLLSALTTLAADREGDSVGPWALHLDKELWVPGEEAGSVSLTFEVPLAFEVNTHLSTPAPTMLLFFVASKRTEILEVTFSSDGLLPNKQTACLSVGTQFIVLTRRVSETGSPRVQTMWITVELKQPNRGPKLSLSEVQALLMKRGEDDDDLRRPLLIFVPNKPPNKDKPDVTSTDHSALSPLPPPPSRTYQFLCELHRFLSDVLPQTKTSPSPSGHALPLVSLSSLPPLTLGESSSQTLLLGLLNSSTPMLFSFPRRGAGLLGHRVALSLQPPLLAMLRQGLVDALAKFRSEGVGVGHLTDRLERLSDLSALPAEGVDQFCGDGESGESQYHALLLLKALQTVLGAWEADRAQRPTRGGKESSGQTDPCRLRSLTISLEAFFLEPSVATINNCEGECGFPLPKGNNHAILVNSLVQKGGWTGRAPCCVPIEYGDLLVVELDKDGTTIYAKTNMVAKDCGCR